MTNYHLTRQTAFGVDAAAVRTVGTATLRELPNIALASVTARKGQGDVVAAAIGTKFGAPCAVGAFVQGDQLSAFWTGPNQWFVMANHEDLAAELKADLGDTASVTEQNDGWVVFELTGEALSNVLERLCNVDLSTLGEGRAQRTLIEHIPCFVLSVDRGRMYRLACGRSYALSFVHAIELALKAANALKADAS